MDADAEASREEDGNAGTDLAVWTETDAGVETILQM
jgi:hypothetical protein